jgi:hypothetical protein
VLCGLLRAAPNVLSALRAELADERVALRMSMPPQRAASSVSSLPTLAASLYGVTMS